jgi:WD40 repeat protein
MTRNNQMRPRILLAALLLAAIVALELQAAPLPDDPPAKAEANALSPGALMRLGSTRFRHGSQVWALGLSPDGKILASGGRDGVVKLWETDTGKLLHSLTKGRQDLRTVTFAPDGKTVAFGGTNFVIHLYNPLTGQEIRTFGQHNDMVLSLSYTADGKTLASSAENSIYLWDPATGQLVRRWEAHKDAVRCVAFAPDGKTVASVGLDGAAHLWNAANGQKIRSFEGSDGWLWFVAFSRDGKMVAAVGKDGLRLWDPASGKLIKTLKQPSSVPRPQLGVAFSPDGKLVVSGGYDTWIHVFDIASGKELRTLRGQNTQIFDLAFSPDGKALASVGNDGIVHRWDPNTGKELRLPGDMDEVREVAFMPDGKLMVTGGRGEPAIRVWELASGKEVRGMVAAAGIASHSINGMALAPNGKLLASAGVDRTVRLWDPATAKELQKIPVAAATLAFTPDSKTLASIGFGPLVHLWDAATGKELRSWKADAAGVSMLAYAPDGKLLATLGQDRQVRLWDPITAQEVRVLGKANTFARTLLFSPDGHILAAPGEQPGLHLWEVATGKEIPLAKGVGGSGNPLAFSADGQLIASSIATQITIWELASGKELCGWKGHEANVNALAFAPDGRTLVSGSSDRTAILWDVTGRGRWPSTPPKYTAKELETHWNALTSEDIKVAYQSVWALAAAPDQSVALLRERLKPAAAADANPILTGRQLQEVRALVVLEQTGKPEAAKLLQALGKGAAGAALTRHAQAAGERLAKRTTVP